jgi:hypothetical protein
MGEPRDLGMHLDSDTTSAQPTGWSEASTPLQGRSERAEPRTDAEEAVYLRAEAPRRRGGGVLVGYARTSPFEQGSAPRARVGKLPEDTRRAGLRSARPLDAPPHPTSRRVVNANTIISFDVA